MTNLNDQEKQWSFSYFKRFSKSTAADANSKGCHKKQEKGPKLIASGPGIEFRMVKAARELA